MVMQENNVPPEVWAAIAACVESKDAPPWMTEYLHSRASGRTPELKAAYHCEAHELDRSYLEHLEEQIDLEPRGKEWSEVLRNRLVALAPHVGENLLRVTLLFEPDHRMDIVARYVIFAKFTHFHGKPSLIHCEWC